MPGIREDWFPTSIFYFDEENPEDLNRELLKLILEERERDEIGMTNRSSVLGWHSGDDLARREAFAPFVSIMQRNVAEVIEFNRWDLSQVEPKTLNCWAIVNEKDSSNQVHNHPSSHLSGVYYVKAPEKGGELTFRDPREVAWMFQPPLTESTPLNFRTITYKPTEGRMLIFPSWLNHGVTPNQSDEARVVISFNIGFNYLQG